MEWRCPIVATCAVLLAAPSVVSAQPASPIPVQELALYQWLVIGFVTVVVLGLSLLAMTPDWGERAVNTARGSSVLSLLVGLPAVALLALAAWAGTQLTSTFIWAGLGIPLAGIAVVAAIICTTVGLVAVGASIGSLVGGYDPWRGVLVGAVLGVVLALIPTVGPALLALVTTIGVGASVRATFGSGGLDARERAVPPANQV